MKALFLLSVFAGFLGLESLQYTSTYGPELPGWVNCGCHEAPTCEQCGPIDMCHGDCRFECILGDCGCFPKNGYVPTGKYMDQEWDDFRYNALENYDSSIANITCPDSGLSEFKKNYLNCSFSQWDQCSEKLYFAIKYCAKKFISDPPGFLICIEEHFLDVLPECWPCIGKATTALEKITVLPSNTNLDDMCPNDQPRCSFFNNTCPTEFPICCPPVDGYPACCYPKDTFCPFGNDETTSDATIEETTPAATIEETTPAVIIGETTLVLEDMESCIGEPDRFCPNPLQCRCQNNSGCPQDYKCCTIISTPIQTCCIPDYYPDHMCYNGSGVNTGQELGYFKLMAANNIDDSVANLTCSTTLDSNLEEVQLANSKCGFRLGVECARQLYIAVKSCIKKHHIEECVEQFPGVLEKCWPCIEKAICLYKGDCPKI